MTAPVLSGPSATSSGPAPSLPEYESTILRLVAKGLTQEEIGRQLHVSRETVNKAMQRIMRLLGARNCTHAVFLACQAGILDGRPQRHGDHAGYAAHVYRKEDPCKACQEGEREYRRKQRAARKPLLSDAA